MHVFLFFCTRWIEQNFPKSWNFPKTGISDHVKYFVLHVMTKNKISTFIYSSSCLICVSQPWSKWYAHENEYKGCFSPQLNGMRTVSDVSDSGSTELVLDTYIFHTSLAWKSWCLELGRQLIININAGLVFLCAKSGIQSFYITDWLTVFWWMCRFLKGISSKGFSKWLCLAYCVIAGWGNFAGIIKCTMLRGKIVLQKIALTIGSQHCLEGVKGRGGNI